MVKKPRCEVCGIARTGKNTTKIFLATFPKEPKRCRLWVKATGYEDLAYLPLSKLSTIKYVCGDHFSPEMWNKKGNRLQSFAVPTLNLINPPLSDDVLAEFPLDMTLNQKRQDISTGISLDYAVSTSEIGADNDMQLAEEPAHCSDISTGISLNYAVSTSVAEADSDMQLEEEPGHYSDDSQDFPASTVEVSNHDEIKPEAVNQTNTNTKPHTKETLDDSQDFPASTVEVSNHDEINAETVDQTNTKPHTKETIDTVTLGKLTIKITPENQEFFEQMHATQKFLESYQNMLQDEDQAQTNKTSANVNKYKKIKLTRPKIKLIKQLQATQKLLEILTNSDFNLDSLESDFVKEMAIQATKNESRDNSGKRWSMKTKIACMQIFIRSPKLYRDLQNNMPMPSAKTVLSLLQKLSTEPGINAALLKQLQHKASTMQPENKLCTLIFDVISLKDNVPNTENSENTNTFEGLIDCGPTAADGSRQFKKAEKALVFMIQSIQKKCKQPLAYYFVKDTISPEQMAKLIHKTIKSLQDATFTVVATVCDHAATNFAALAILKQNSQIHTDAHYFNVNDSKIYIIFDVPHLFKSIRNNFHDAGGMEMDGKIARWKHLREAEELNREMLHFYKITPKLLKPKQKMKLNVKYAAHTLSNTFAAILRMMALKHEGTTYGYDLEQTSEVVRDLNNLFDVTNGPEDFYDVIKDRRENVSEKTNHLEMWNMYLNKIPTMRFLKNDAKIQLKAVRCVQGYVTTIRSFKDIWFDWEFKGFTYLNLRQLNQDKIEQFFQYCSAK